MKNLLHSLTPAAAILGISATIAFACFGFSSASAADVRLITIPSTDLPTAKQNENDCSGYFGKRFANCIITGASPNRTEFSPVIAKFDAGTNRAIAINSKQYRTIDRKKFTFTFNGTSDNFPSRTSTGNWTYTPKVGEPVVKYWVAKGGNRGFNLFFHVPDTAKAAEACKIPYSDACLGLAVVTTSGTWKTPLNSNGNKPGLSHITFYGSMNEGGNGRELTFEPTSGKSPDNPPTGTGTYTTAKGDADVTADGAAIAYKTPDSYAGLELAKTPDSYAGLELVKTPDSYAGLELAPFTTSETGQTPSDAIGSQLNSHDSHTDLSHITSYNSMNGGKGESLQVPEPGVIPALLAIAGLGLGIRSKKQL